MKCYANFTEENRKSINEKYKALSFEDKTNFILQRMVALPVERRSRAESKERMMERECSYKFQLNEQTVCRDMFLRTLGITGRVLHRIRNLSTAKDKRGSSAREKKTTLHFFDPDTGIRCTHRILQSRYFALSKKACTQPALRGPLVNY